VIGEDEYNTFLFFRCRSKYDRREATQHDYRPPHALAKQRISLDRPVGNLTVSATSLADSPQAS